MEGKNSCQKIMQRPPFLGKKGGGVARKKPGMTGFFHVTRTRGDVREPPLSIFLKKKNGKCVPKFEKFGTGSHFHRLPFIPFPSLKFLILGRYALYSLLSLPDSSWVNCGYCQEVCLVDEASLENSQ